MCILKLLQDLAISYLKVMVGVRTKDKPLVRAENSSYVKVWQNKPGIMFLLYWEMYVLMVATVNSLNEDFHWICGKRTVIGGDVYMRLNGDEGTRAPSLCHCHMQK